jgi:hypothetical protein
MKKYFIKPSSTIPYAIGLFTLLASAANADPVVTQAASQDFNGVVQGVSTSAAHCPGQADLPDAPSSLPSQNNSTSPGTKPARFTRANVLTKIKFRTSTALEKDPTSAGPLSFSDESLGVTFGDIQISEMLARSEIPNTPDTKVYFNVNVTVAPAAGALAKTAGASSIAAIKQDEAGVPWEQSDINNANQRVKTLQANALQAVTVSAAVVTKDGKIYACEVGRSPEGFIPADSPDGLTNSMENATGGPSDALRVGSSFSTNMGKCTAVKSLKNDSKFSVGFEGYKNTLPYKNLNTTFADTFYSNNQGYNANKVGVPDTFRVNGNLTENFNATTQAVVNGTVGVTSGNHFIYSVSGSVTKKDNTLMGATGKNTYTSMTGTNPLDPASPNYAQNQTGSFVAFTRPIYSNFSVVGAAEWDKGVPDAADANTQNKVVNFNVKKVGVEYTHDTVHIQDGDLLTQRQGETRLTAGVYYQYTTSPDGSLTQTGSALTANLKLTTSGDWRSTFQALKQLKVVLPKKETASVSTTESDCTTAVNGTVHLCAAKKDQ